MQNESKKSKLFSKTKISTWLLILMLFHGELCVCEPQLKLINSGCSQYNVSNMLSFRNNLNATFGELKDELEKINNSRRPKKQKGSDPAYAMIQCRKYMSGEDCMGCFEAAKSRILNCSAANGARVIYDGCFLRYESNSFFDQSTQEGHFGICGNRTESSIFGETVGGLLKDLTVVTPKTKGFYVATKRESANANENANAATVYGLGQCIESISKKGCEDCMKVVYTDIAKCPPNTDGRAVDVGCFLRYSHTPFFAENNTMDITPYLKGSSNSKKWLIGGLVGGVGSLLIIIGLIICYLKSYTKNKPNKRGDILGSTELQGPLIYRYKDLSYATKNFSQENKLGQGGFGDVYKGVLKNGKIVAVKKLGIGESRRVQADFESEVKLISNVHHRNLIRLLGCCSKGSQLLLVYEYMANKSLDQFLFGERRGSLNWKQRFDIILGTARGLAYLHEEFHVCIIHRDIKSSNILLDDDFHPKIADFGLARLLPENQSHLSTKFAGTLGYTAPEYAIHGQLSEKVDTYSYGIVVLEIISGRKSNEINQDSDAEFLLKQAWRLYENDRQLQLVDTTLDLNEYNADEVKKIIEIALLCTQSIVSSRPTMSEVVVLLKSKGDNKDMSLPNKPAFIEVRQETSSSSASSKTASNATASITKLSGR